MKRLVACGVAVACLAGTPDDRLTAQPSIPAPASAIGFEPCADYKLATYEQIANYFRLLDASSDRMQLVDIGTTAEGRTQLMAVISSEANMQRLDHYKAISAQLARARGISDAQARGLAAEGRAVVWINFGLHSTEVGHAQTAPLVAHHTVTDESSEMRNIRDNVIFLLVPDMNPDGTTLMADWYMKHVGTPYQDTSPPELYQKYAGHDNNRDWFMFNLRETRNVARQLYAEWFPQIVYDQHQSGPFPSRIFIPPFADPTNPNIPPRVMRGVNLVGEAMARRLDQEGKTGAISRIGYDTWWNGGMRTAPYYHNMIGLLTETSHASATPAVYEPRTFPRTFADGRPTLEPTIDYPHPYLGGEWHLRDTCDYMRTTSMAVLDIGAQRRTEWLHGIYDMGREAIEAGQDEVYVVSSSQWDHGTAAKLINALRRGGVEVERAIRPFSVAGRTYPADSFVIRGAQPFRPYVTDLLNPQVYPDTRRSLDGGPDPPYDITGWTLPMQMGVVVDRHSGSVQAPPNSLVPVEWAEVGDSVIRDRATVAFALDPRANDSFTAVNRLLAAGETVYRAKTDMAVDRTRWPPGTFIVPAGPETRARIEASTASLGLRVGAVAEYPRGTLRRLDQPRIGLYHGWGGNPDEGWTRWVLEQFEFPYARVHDEDVRANRLEYDVIVLPDAGYNRMVNGLSSTAAPPEYTGGMTSKGVTALYEYVQRGGTLVTLDSASELPIVDFGLPVRNIADGRAAADVMVPGALLEIETDPTHPVAYGMPARAVAFVSSSPVFRLGDGSQRPAGRPPSAADEGLTVVARYPKTNLLRSGWLIGEDVLAGRPAAIEASLGRGRVILLGFRAQHRGQPHGTFKLLFNALYLGATRDLRLAQDLRE